MIGDPPGRHLGHLENSCPRACASSAHSLCLLSCLTPGNGIVRVHYLSRLQVASTFIRPLAVENRRI